MAHGEFEFYSKCSGHPLRILKNVEITYFDLRDKSINLAEVSIDCGARVKARRPVTRVRDDGGLGCDSSGGGGEKWPVLDVF